jgi:hypothetical protein
MWQSLGDGKTVKEVWEVVKVMHLGADRMKEVNAQKLLRDFENIAFKDGELIEDFCMRITDLVGNVKTLGETMEDVRVIKNSCAWCWPGSLRWLSPSKCSTT